MSSEKKKMGLLSAQFLLPRPHPRFTRYPYSYLVRGMSEFQNKAIGISVG